ncbi:MULTISPECIES: hypothetical protein [Chryseobacterium]|uniref:Conjugal transfer protein TraD n=1 Tax=Chryseobacterium fistulae TaxID=2675058 RepID=A0A6N4XKU1_9FLAO|nr:MULTISPECIES: hypothetical protein [Chryseobacterium]CAA7385803.1 hypothetical protein CHRY9393_00089 [Chryseobacterium fistulae]CAD0224652.1 conserved protein of unknown function [Chryseobacterium sp. JV274]
MEKIIIIGLLIAIILILLDRRFPVNVHAKDSGNTKKISPSIMGDIKQTKRKGLPVEATESHLEFTSLVEDNFESETRNGKAEDVAENKNLDDILIKDNWGQEEEDWKYQDSNIESGFATGVTFQELSTAGQLLQRNMLEPDLEQQAVAIIQKIHGTELFDLLENSLGEASKRISNLLSQSISNDVEGISSSYKDGVEGFDIGEFV